MDYEKHKYQAGIYKITNILNGKIYIGSAHNFCIRWNVHKITFNKGKHNPYFQKAWIKYGELNFSFEILEIVDDTLKLLEREQFYLDELKPFIRNIGYNICEKAASRKGCKDSKQTIERKRIAFTGEKNPMFGKKGNLSPHYGKGKKVYQYSIDGTFIKMWNSSQLIYDELGFNKPNISLCCTGKRKTYKKFIWSFEELKNKKIRNEDSRV